MLRAASGGAGPTLILRFDGGRRVRLDSACPPSAGPSSSNAPAWLTTNMRIRSTTMLRIG
jgi:hypothetical protein